jgi:hypothetical protein
MISALTLIESNSNCLDFFLRARDVYYISGRTERAAAPVVNAQSSSVLLSIGAPSFGGGGSFDTLDFSLPRYDEATSGGDIAKSSSSSPAAPTAPKVDDSAARAAAKEEREASRIAEAEAKEAQKKADEASAKEAAEKAVAKEAAKEERKAS